MRKALNSARNQGSSKKALNSARNQGSSKKALITGIGGFAGSHLAQHLISQKISVSGFVHPNHPSHNLEYLDIKAHLIKCDILDKESVVRNIKNTSFDYIFHLAAFSSPQKSFENPKETLENNILGQLNILETLAKNKSKAKILIIGSSDEYGNAGENNSSVGESVQFNPSSPYAVSKTAQDLLGRQFFLNQKLNVVRVRPFNHIGPMQTTAFVVPAFANQIADLEKKGDGLIKVGNLNVYRDFTDVRDVVKAYLLAVEKGKVGDVYNIGSGKAYKIADILDKLISFSTVKIKIKKDKKLFRKENMVKIICDFSKFKKMTGWEPQIPIEKTLSDTIDYERSRLN